MFTLAASSALISIFIFASDPAPIRRLAAHHTQVHTGGVHTEQRGQCRSVLRLWHRCTLTLTVISRYGTLVRQDLHWPTVSNLYLCSWSVLSTRRGIIRCLLWTLWILNWCIYWRTTPINVSSSPAATNQLYHLPSPVSWLRNVSNIWQRLDTVDTGCSLLREPCVTWQTRGTRARPRRVPGHDPAGDTCTAPASGLGWVSW